jgi:Flp pilus assembly protein TadB
VQYSVKVISLMVCRRCGTQIADNALICYRCGTAVDDVPSVPRVRPGRRAGLFGPALAFVILAIGALFLGRAAAHELPREVSWTILALAVLLLAWWVRARRRRQSARRQSARRLRS